MKTEHPQVTFLVANYNRKEYLRRCLLSLLKQTYSDFQIIVIDNNSSDGSAEMVEKEFPSVQAICLEKNFGHAIAVNKGVEASKSKYIAIVDNDTILEKDWLKVLVGFMEENHEASVCGSKILDPCTGKITSVGGLVSVFSATRDGQYETDKNQYGRSPFRVPYVSAGAMLFRRKILADLKYCFHPSFFIGYNDLEFCLRAWLAGHEVFVLPTSVAYHRFSLGNWSAQRIYLGSKNYLQTMAICLDANHLWCILELVLLFLCKAIYSRFSKADAYRNYARGYLWAIVGFLRSRKKISKIRKQIRRVRSDASFLQFHPSPFSVIKYFQAGYRNSQIRNCHRKLIL